MDSQSYQTRQLKVTIIYAVQNQLYDHELQSEGRDLICYHGTICPLKLAR